MFKEQQDRGMPLAVHIAVGVAAGSVVAAVCIFYFWQWQLRQAAQEAAAQLKASIASTRAEADRNAELARRAEAARRIELASAERAAEERKRKLLLQSQQLEEAWARFYRKPAQCDESRGGNWSVDCANDFIRAKRAFAERQSSAGPDTRQ